MTSRWQLTVLVVTALSCGARVDESASRADTAGESEADGADVDLPPPWEHGPECEGIVAMPGVRVVAHRDGANISMEASRDPISCGATAQSLCSGSDECYGHPINTLRFPAALEPGVYDLQAMVMDEEAELYCSSCDFVGICAFQGSGSPPPTATLVIEDVTEQRIRGCIRETGDVCFAVAFDVAFCE